MKRLGLGLALLLIVSACGGDGADLPGATTSTDATVVGEAVAGTVEAGDALVARWGDEDAFLVVLWAMDAGYSAAQIIDAAVDDRVGADGLISSSDGGVLEPDGEPQGRLSVDGPSAFGYRFVTARYSVSAQALDEPSEAYVADLDGFASEIFEAGQASIREFTADQVALAGVVLELAYVGYSFDQILEALYFGDVRAGPSESGSLLCWGVIGEGGQMVVPANEPSISRFSAGCQGVPDRPEVTEGEDAEADESSDDGQTASNEADEADEDAVPDGEYSGVFKWSAWGTSWASFSQDQIDITIQDGEVTALVISIHGVVNLASHEDENDVVTAVTCSGPAGYEADVGPGVLRVDGTSITGDIQLRFFLGTVTGSECDEQYPFDNVGPMSIDAKFDRDEFGDEITGTLIGACEDCDANIPLSFAAWRP